MMANININQVGAILSAAIHQPGFRANGHAGALGEYGSIFDAILAAPETPYLRSQAFEAAIAGLESAADLRKAVFAADPVLPDISFGQKTFADVEKMIGPLEWAWPLWLLKGFVTILASESGTGKSALALAICDIFIRNRYWPDGAKYDGEPGKVVWCEAEAAQAIQLERARKWGVPIDSIWVPLDDPTGDFSLTDAAHKDALTDLAHNREVRLVVIDSLSGADPKAEKSVEDAGSIKWLSQLARDSNKPILVCHHLRKKNLFDGGEINLDRLRGSSALVQTARVVWALDIPDPQSRDWKRLQVIKSNVAKFPPPVGIAISEAGIEFGDSPEQPKTPSVIDRAVDLLLALLQSEPQPADLIYSEFNGAGISVPTLKRAKSKLGIVSTKKADGWYWGLPGCENHEQRGLLI